MAAKKTRTARPAAKTGPRGRTGPRGPAGPPGPIGLTGPAWESPELADRIAKLERAVLVLVRTCDHLLKSRHTHPTDPAAQQIKPEEAR